MSPVFLAGLVAPVAVLVAGGARGAAVRAPAGRRRCSPSGSARSSAFTCGSLDRLDALGRRSARRAGARGAAAPGASRSPRSTAACARARCTSATSRTTIERFRSAVEAMPDGMVVLDAANRIEWANARAQAHLGLDLAQGHRAGRCSTSCASPRSSATSRAGDFTDAVVVDSLREPGTTLSIQVVPFGVDERLLISRDITQLEAVARMRRDFIANVSHELKTPLTVVSRLPRDAAGPRARAAAARALPAADGGAGAEHAAPGRRPADAVGARKRAEPLVAETRSRSCRCCSKLSADAKALSQRPAHDRARHRRRRRSCRAAATSSRARSATS